MEEWKKETEEFLDRFKKEKGKRLGDMDDKEATQFLIEVINYWVEEMAKKREKNEVWFDIFCGGAYFDLDKRPKEEWRFYYTDHQRCWSCLRAQWLLDKIFNDRRRFEKLPFVKHYRDEDGYNVYKFSIEEMENFVKRDEVVALTEDIKICEKDLDELDNFLTEVLKKKKAKLLQLNQLKEKKAKLLQLKKNK